MSVLMANYTTPFLCKYLINSSFTKRRKIFVSVVLLVDWMKGANWSCSTSTKSFFLTTSPSLTLIMILIFHFDLLSPLLRLKSLKGFIALPINNYQFVHGNLWKSFIFSPNGKHFQANNHNPQGFSFQLA